MNHELQELLNIRDELDGRIQKLRNQQDGTMVGEVIDKPTTTQPITPPAIHCGDNSTIVFNIDYSVHLSSTNTTTKTDHREYNPTIGTGDSALGLVRSLVSGFIGMS